MTYRIMDLQYVLYCDNGYLHGTEEGVFDIEFENYYPDGDELVFRAITNDLLHWVQHLEELMYWELEMGFIL